MSLQFGTPPGNAGSRYQVGRVQDSKSLT